MLGIDLIRMTITERIAQLTVRHRPAVPSPVRKETMSPRRHLSSASAALHSKWAPLSIPTGLLVVGLALRLVGALPGWGTLLIVCGIVGGALTAYTVAYGSHERTLDRESLRTADDAKW